jgi:CheY-like chemotaxis protein
LVIDDDADVCEMLANVLQVQGYNVLVSCNGRHGYELAVETLPNLILCDLLMPEMTGFEAINRLHENPRTTRIPVIVLSGESFLRRHAAAPRCAAWVNKPIDLGDFLDLVGQFLSPQPTPLAA